jgi:Skp family chaperone for outer membrane proteins
MLHQRLTGYGPIRGMLAACALLACAVGIPHNVASADPAVPATAQIGSVDLQKIQNGYAKRDDLLKQINDINAQLSDRLKRQSASDMLSADQQSQLGALLAKPQPTDADTAAIAQLENQSSHDTQEMATLQQKADLTDADKLRLNVLMAEHQAGQQALQTTSDSYTDELKEEGDKIQGQFDDKVRAAIAAVAKERGLAVVFDAQLALYTANDITDDVLARLNKS